MPQSPLFISINEEVALPEGQNWNAFIKEVLTLQNIQTGHFDFNFVNKATLLNINKNHLNRDYDTDIITFNLGTKENIIGDIYISIAQAKENAENYGNSWVGEIKLLIIHGILHLMDYRDYTDKEKAIMEKEQNRLIRIIKGVS
ncbi:MAG: rRNA maturation RNase YbeY [bacterium]|nr:rRNA maturation RNase YbeY [bacterium]